MKRLLCILLVLCMCPFCLISCKKDPVPEAVEAKYPVIEGRRIPFRYLFTSAVKNCGDHFVLRSTDEVKQGFQKEFLWYEFGGNLLPSIKGDIEELLLEIDYDSYQVLGITTTAYRDVINPVELIEWDGNLCAVFESDYVAPDPDTPRREYFQCIYTTVVLVRKSDLDLSGWEKPFKLDVTGYECYRNALDIYRKLTVQRISFLPPAWCDDGHIFG